MKITQKKAKTEESKIEETNIVEDEEEKNKRISNLIFNEVQNIQRKYQEESQNKINKDTQRKIKVLENNNVNIEEILKKNEEVFEEEENEKRESDDEKDYEKEFYENNKNISKINLTNNKNDNSHTNTIIYEHEPKKNNIKNKLSKTNIITFKKEKLETKKNYLKIKEEIEDRIYKRLFEKGKDEIDIE